MASEKYKGIIIESKDYKEKDKLVSIYTLEKGLVRAVFRGVRGEKAKMRASKDVFTFGDFFIENTKGNNIVSQVDIIEGFYAIREDLDKYYEACSIVDVLKKVATEQPDPKLFIEVIKALKYLCFGQIKRNYVLCKYLLDIFSGAGYPMNFTRCSSCGAQITGKKFFNYDIGEILCGNCRTYTAEEIEQPVVSFLKILSGTDYDKLETVKFGDETIKSALKVLLKNFQYRFGKEIFAVV